MQTSGQTSRNTGDYAPVNATTPEESYRLAMGASYVPMPVALIGVKDLAGETLLKIVHEPVIVVAPVVESVETPMVLEEGETMIADTRDDMIIVEDPEMGLAEVIMISQDGSGNVWVTIRDTDGHTNYYSRKIAGDRWGRSVDIEIAAAEDRAFIRNLRKAHNLIAA